MIQVRRGFTLVELVTAVAVTGLLVAVLLPMAGRQRQADELQTSLTQMRKIIQGTQQYHADHAGQVPMRGGRYSNGQLSAWDSWNVGGKNCDVFWATSGGGPFDESAYSRLLNPYVSGSPIPRPPGYVNTGAGPTWTFNPGNPSAADRAGHQEPTFRSPGDVATRQRNWPQPTPGVSAYDDVGTSYLLNMKWWDEPGLPSNFTAKYNVGGQHVAACFDGGNPGFVFMHDQVADVVAYSAPGTTIPGEFGGNNMSVVGYADGRAAYVEIIPGRLSGPGYTFGFPVDSPGPLSGHVGVAARH